MRQRSSSLDFSTLLEWLQHEIGAVNANGKCMSWWPHSADRGFGIVMVVAGSGEFHFMPDGEVSLHVEMNGIVTLSSSARVVTMLEFKEQYEAFKAEVCKYPQAEGEAPQSLASKRQPRRRRSSSQGPKGAA
jgi:hypothetical protein